MFLKENFSKVKSCCTTVALCTDAIIYFLTFLFFAEQRWEEHFDQLQNESMLKKDYIVFLSKIRFLLF